MPSRDFDAKTPDGTELGLATSALIKALRRGQEGHACYWASQIEPMFWRYLFRRLAVFAVEDVGIADEQAVVVVQAVLDAYERAKKESKAPRPDSSFVGFVVLYLARCPKNREGDDLAQAVIHAVEEGWQPRVPPEAIDLHTAEGRARLSRSERLRHWLEVASHAERVRGPQDWRLAIRRWAARRGRLDPAEVEAQAEEWLNEGRLRWGLEGYPFGEEDPWAG